MTTALQVAPKRWREFFDVLTETCMGRALTIEVLGDRLGDQTLGDGLRLQGFSFNSRRPDADLVIEGGNDDAVMVHYVRRPRAVWLAETELGDEADVQVESADRTFTLVRLRRLKALPPTKKASRPRATRQPARAKKKRPSR
jgi:hypothetical protein